MKTLKINRWMDISKDFTGTVEFPSGSILCIKNGKRHRDDGPAAILFDGRKEWWFEGERHREDGPAVEWESGYKEWHLEGIEIYHNIYPLYETYLILDISPHPIYPLVKIHKILLKDKIEEKILIPGMIEYERKQ